MNMKIKHQLMVPALFAASLSYAQTDSTFVSTVEEGMQDASSFTLTESQLGEDDDQTANIIQIGSSSNVYTSNVGYLWSPVRYKFRAYDSRYNDVYMNGVQVNNVENGRFNFSTIGGMNDATRNQDSSNPFEDNRYSMSGIGGSNNYNFRASQMAAGSKATISGANRNYTLRGMYTYGTGLNENGWAFFGTVGYRWANMNTAAVEGTFYNSFSYFLSLQKVFSEKHSLNLATWGNPTERAQQGASTDEAYWLANNYMYNPYWGYQNGKKRSSRIVNNYEPSALLTWDYAINDRMKLTTSAFFKYAMYSSTKLNYNDAQIPAPDYWKNMPSSFYDVWDKDNVMNWEYGLQSWYSAYDRWTLSKANRQIDFDELYAKNQGLNADGKDAAYYIQAKHNDHLTTNLASTFDWKIDKEMKLVAGLQLGSNKGMHYQTLEDLMGADNLHNVNNYAIGTYSPDDPRVQYDLRNYDPTNPYSEANRIKEGDRFGYDYNLISQNARLWTTFARDKGISHNYISAKIGGTQMWRVGRMENGLCQGYSYGKSGVARFLDGGFKMGSTLNLGGGNAIAMGVGYETRAPQANVAFESPELNNNFVKNLKNEKVFTAELGYAANCSWLRANITGYFTHTFDGTDWQQFYNDDENSFTYNSITGISKNYYGVEAGLKFKVTSNFDINLMGTYSDNKILENTQATYLNSTECVQETSVCYNKGMREGGTPLAVASLGVDYRVRGWYLSLVGNYYDRIYLYYSPNMRYKNTLENAGAIDNLGNYIVPDQAKGDGGFMLDASIGKQFRIGKNPMSVNLTLTNLTNNRDIVTGGYEQSRSNYSMRKNGDKGSERLYDFSQNPKKYYAQGFNFMLNVNYRF